MPFAVECTMTAMYRLSSPRRRVRNRLALRVAAVVLALAAAIAAGAGSNLQHDVVFDQPSPLASNGTMLERLFSPLLAAALRAELTKARGSTTTSALDLIQERFELYVPEGQPPAVGYGLLVFVPPWESQGLPREWLAVLDRQRMIAVTAERSGNSQNVLSRRIPLAISGYENVRRRYRLDPQRVYVGGFSGGARVALRMALAFPDVFHGALLNAGSDTFGTPEVPLPDAALFAQFERGTRLVYATGTRDESVAATDRRSHASARVFCVSNLVDMPIRGGGHEPADARTFERALRELDGPRVEMRDVEACRARRSEEVARANGEALSAFDAGDLKEAARKLAELDARYGGLALPASAELAGRLRERGIEPLAKP
jgi:pimeloyl-ACP methyl ester carboxylesterase